MTMTDPLADMLTRIRNGLMAEKQEVRCPDAKLRRAVLEVLRREGYIRAWRVEEGEGPRRDVVIELKYHQGGPAIREISRVSRPGLRVYSPARDIPRHYAGLGIHVLSTPSGVMSDHEARKANVGGEILCRVF